MRQVLFAGAVMASLLFSGAAQAAPLAGSFEITVWNGNGGGTIDSPGVQALPSNPLNQPSSRLAVFDYTGGIDFTTTTNTILSFFQSAGGSIAGLDPTETTALGTTLSQPGFANTTLVRITGILAVPVSSVLLHDDGVSLFQGGVNVLPAAAARPAELASTAYSLGGGPFSLWYVEANGLPARLTMDATPVPVPEPAELALFGAGLLGLAAVRRRARGSRRSDRSI